MNNLRLINGSCVEQEVDVIVNAANRYLMSGGGICGAIFERAGYASLNEACKKINIPLNDGDSVITSAFNISNAKYIIHAVGPDFSATPEAVDKLEDAYYNSLKLLKENNLHSIAFPLISSGIFGGNLDNSVGVSAQCCKNAYNRFIKEYENYDVDVILCAYTEQEYRKCELIFN